MGTRNLTMVFKDNETKVAQYGQWDGYPAGNGKKIVNFLKKVDLAEFKKNVDKVSFFTDKEIEAIPDENWKENYPQLSRDVGADVLLMIDGRELKLNNQEVFAADSLYNEWTFLINLDNDTLECYAGFNKKKVPKKERFAKYNDYAGPEKIGKEYQPIKLKKVYDFHNLPTVKEFIKELDPEDEEAK